MNRLVALLVLVVGCSGAGGSPGGAAPLPPRRAAAASDAWWNGAVVYQVYVRSFKDSDGDGHGDLPGLIERLDDLNDGDSATTSDLGVDALWLMPINPSPSVHGYDVTDYDGVNPDYGTMADFDRLVAECHRRGIKVVLDFVVNHTSDQHPWFQASRSGDPAQRSWYLWAATDQGWLQPWGPGRTWYQNPLDHAWYYALFWSGMPDLNWRDAGARGALTDAARRWLGRGVDGFRLDAVRYLVESGGGSQADQPETHRALAQFAADLQATRPDTLLVGEVWADAPTIATYYGATPQVPGPELPLAFDFPLAEAILIGASQGRAQPVAAALDAVTRAYPAGAADAPFLSNHDQVRTATRLGSDPGAMRVAAGVLLTLPGTPFLYYGEEIGLPNPGSGCSGDECKRAPMAWDASAGGGFTSGTPWLQVPSPGPTVNVAAQRADPASLRSAYRALIAARTGSAALRRGDLQLLQDPATITPLLAFSRAAPGETVLVVHNLGGAFATATGLQVPGRVAFPVLVPDGAVLNGIDGRRDATLPPRSTAIWRLEP